mgnify:FL=1
MITYIVNTFARMICHEKPHEIPHKIPPDTRIPTENEMQRGLPEWFRVQCTETGKHYFSIHGQKFHSIQEVKKWRENLKFELSVETSDDEAPSF